jgi:nitrogen regulatory protein P-II 1
MKRIETTIPASKLEEVKTRLFQVGAQGLTASEVRRFGRPDGRREPSRGSAHELDGVPNLRLQIVADEEMVHPIVEAIRASARTGGPEDGQIFILPVNDVIRIRTGERGPDAL